MYGYIDSSANKIFTQHLCAIHLLRGKQTDLSLALLLLKYLVGELQTYWAVATEGGKCRDERASVSKGNYEGGAPTQTRSFGGSGLSGDVNNKRALVSSPSGRERGEGGICRRRDPEARESVPSLGTKSSGAL